MKYIPITLSSIAIILSACPKNPSEGTSTNSTTSELTSTSNNSIPTSNGIETSNGPTSENETSISESTLTSNNSTSTDSSTTLTTSTSFSTTSSTNSTSDTGNIEFCGNAILEGIEQCDDGNIEDIDLCDNNCQKSRFIFLSSDYIGGSGGFGGIEKADAFCQKDATLFKLPGTYKSWLNDCKNTLITRLNSESFFGWYLLPKLNDKYIEVAKGWTELTSGVLKNPVDTIGNGNKPLEASMVWTNTLVDGNVYGNDTCCFDWTVKDPTTKGHVGLSSSTMSQWTNVGPMGCDKGAKLYCIQVTD